MGEAIAEAVKESAAAVQIAAKPQVFPVMIAFLALASSGFLVYRTEQRADAQIAVLQSISQHIADLDSDLRAVGVPVGKTKTARAAVQAVERE